MTNLKKLLLIISLVLTSANAKAETYSLDPTHTAVTWNINHFGFSNPSGKFMSAKGTLVLDEQKPENSKVEVVIDVTKLNSGLEGLDKALEKEEFFDIAKYPTAKFVSTKVEKTGEKTAKVAGNLTIKGITKPVVLDVTLNGMGENFEKIKTVGFSGGTNIKRSDFGMTSYLPMLGDDVRLQIESEAIIKLKVGNKKI